MMDRLDVVGLGLASLDVLVRLRDIPTWQRGSSMSAFALDGGGMAATAMAAAARLGARAGFVGTAGSDTAARIKVDSLAADGVDLSRLVARDGPERQVILVCVDESTGERVFCGLQSLGQEQLQPEELDRDYITSARCLHLDGFHYAAALQAAKWMREAGKTVVYDGGRTSGSIGKETRALLEYVDVLICGSGFAPALTGRTDRSEAGRAALAAGPRIVVQTDGPGGSCTVAAEQQFCTPAFQVDVVDTTGAGDVFHGAYIVGLLRGWSLPFVAQFASAVAAVKCTRLGGRAGIPRFNEVMAFLKDRGVTPA